MIKACLFDLDGTILDTLTTIAHFGNEALKKFGIETIDREEYKYLAGSGAKKLVERMLRFRGAYTEETFCRVYEYYVSIYDANPTYLTEVFDGIEELLGFLKKENIAVGVITNKPDFAAKSVCREKFAKGLIDAVQGQTEDIPIKPAPDGALMLLGEFGVTGEQTIYVGDTSVDMQTGKKLGAYTVGVLWGFRGEKELTDSGADKIVSHPDEIIDIVNKLKNF